MNDMSAPAPTADEARDEVTIAGVGLTLANPYVTGHVCTAGEASQLNQVRHENIRNNQAKVIGKAVEDAGGVDKVDVAALQAALDTYDATYAMGVRAKGTGVSRLDPVTREARSIAKEALSNALKKAGRKIGDLSAELISSKVGEILDRHPEFVELAKARVAERKEAASVDIADIAA